MIRAIVLLIAVIAGMGALAWLRNQGHLLVVVILAGLLGLAWLCQTFMHVFQVGIGNALRAFGIRLIESANRRDDRQAAIRQAQQERFDGAVDAEFLRKAGVRVREK